MVVFTLVVSRTTTIALCGMVMRTMPLRMRTRTSVAANVLKKITAIQKPRQEDEKCQDNPLFEDGNLLVHLQL